MKNIITEIACITSLLKLIVISHTEIENFPQTCMCASIDVCVCERTACNYGRGRPHSICANFRSAGSLAGLRVAPPYLSIFVC